MRPCELVGVMLLGLLPTHAINAVPPTDPATIYRPAGLAFAPTRLLRGVSPRKSVDGRGVMCHRSPGISLRGGRVNSHHLVRAALSGHAHSNGKHLLDAEANGGVMPRQKILVTGGAGYIGSHICADLLQLDYDVVVLDNFANSSPTALERAMELGGRELTVYEGDTRDLAALRHVFESELSISSVIHLAGLKAVGESVAKPTMYYDYK